MLLRHYCSTPYLLSACNFRSVSAAPTLLSSPASITVTEGSNATFECSYTGDESPVTNVRWLKDGEPLREGGGPPRHLVTDVRGNVTLFFRSVDISDTGRYKCEISTKGFPLVFSEHADLLVKEKLKFWPLPASKRLELGSSAKVYCKAQGATHPTVKWIKVGHTGEFPQHIEEDVNGTLHFNGVVEQDKGKYTCIATNSQGSVNHTITIDVVSK